MKLPSGSGSGFRIASAGTDLLLVIGTSLAVAPISKVMGWLPPATPQVLVNRDVVAPPRAASEGFDVSLIGEADTVVAHLAHAIGLAIPPPDAPPDASPCPDGGADAYDSVHAASAVTREDAAVGRDTYACAIAAAEVALAVSDTAAKSADEALWAHPRRVLRAAGPAAVVGRGAVWAPSLPVSIEAANAWVASAAAQLAGDADAGDEEDASAETVSCDGCAVKLAPRDILWACGACFDYDLCGRCYGSKHGRHTQDHGPAHTFVQER
jgi:hypothetical protein